jgi:ABC-type lipoprotein export system ATPase subunit
MSLLRRFNGDGQTMVVVTHDPSVASHARRVLFMRDGRLVDETRLKAPGQTSAVLSRLVKLED